MKFFLAIFTLLLICACSSGKSSNDNTIIADSDSVEASDNALNDSEGAISSESDDNDEIDIDLSDIDVPKPSFISGPAITMAPNPQAPLAGLLEITASEPVTVSLKMNDGTEETEVSYKDLAAEHSLPVLGFKPDKTYSIEVSITNVAGGRLTAEAIIAKTDPLPDNFPPITVLMSTQDKLEPGFLFFHITHSVDNAYPDKNYPAFIIALNSKSEVVWYYTGDYSGLDFKRLSNGNLIIQYGRELREIDMLGNVISKYYPAKMIDHGTDGILVDARSFHHEITELPSGNFLSLTYEPKNIDNFPSNEFNPDAPKQTTTVIGDDIIEFTKDGTMVYNYSLFDMIDPLRIGYTSILMQKEWAHANSVVYDANDDSYVVSCRNQSIIIKFDRATGKKIWMLGPHDYWKEEYQQYLLTPSGDNFQWNYYQHQVTLLPDGNFLMFDNSAYRAFPYDPAFPADKNYSRAVIFSVDESAMTVKQIWQYGMPPAEKIYAPFIGGAVLMPQTGNVLITYGGITKDTNGVPSDNLLSCKTSARIIEVTGTQTAEKLLDISIEDKNTGNNGWRIYRSLKLKSLYGKE